MDANYQQAQQEQESFLLKNRILSFEQACEKSRESHERGETVVFTSGVWDILHTAHLHYLMHLKLKGDLLIVGIDNNESVQRLKGEGRPFFDVQERAMTVANIRCVDYVFSFGGVWQVEHLIKLKPDFVGIPSYDPNIENKMEKLALANVKPIITPPFLRSQSSSRKAKLIQYDYLVTNTIVEEFGD